MDILIPASGSFSATIKHETEDGYVCVSPNGGPSILFVYKEFVVPNTENIKPSWNPDDIVPELMVTWQLARRAVEYNAGEILDRLIGPSQ